MTNFSEPTSDEKDPLVDEPAEVRSLPSDQSQQSDPTPYRAENTRTIRKTITFGVSGLLLLFVLGFIAGRSTTTQPQREVEQRGTAQQTENSIEVADIEAMVTSGMVVWDVQLESLLAQYDASNDTVDYVFDDVAIKLSGNGLPNHSIGSFPNPANPNQIRAQEVSISVPRQPTYLGQANNVRVLGVSLGGIPFIPGTTERDSLTGWSVEAFNVSRLFDPGEDENNGTTQANGAYSYIGYPTVLDASDTEAHSSLIGFAADGFPVYGNRSYRDPTNSDGPVDSMTSSWRLKEGERGPGEPAGVYNGDYTQDFEYVADSGDLDKCNGRFTITPEFPDGTYAYFMTLSFPFIGRCVNGEVVESFIEG